MVNEEYAFPRLAKSAGDVIAAGGKVGVGAHGQRQGIGFHWEMWNLAAGMSNHDALRAATLLGAEISGLDHDLGTIDVGKLADLVVLDADPLENIRNTNSIRIGISDDHRVCSATFVSISSWIGKEAVAWQKSKSVTMLF